MRLETQQFVNECLKKASAEINRPRTPEEIEAENKESRRIMDEIHYNGSVALERLEKNGGVRVNYLN